MGFKKRKEFHFLTAGTIVRGTTSQRKKWLTSYCDENSKLDYDDDNVI